MNLFLNINEALNVAWMGMLAIFIAIGIIYMVILIFSLFTKKD